MDCMGRLYGMRGMNALHGWNGMHATDTRSITTHDNISDISISIDPIVKFHK